ncbi:MAG: hypothetical protein U0T85_03270 [Cloacibacterium normanense]
MKLAYLLSFSFSGDANGLHYFDGSFSEEHEDPRKVDLTQIGNPIFSTTEETK